MNEDKNRRKSKFALLLVRESDDGIMSQHTISSRVIEIVAAILFLLIVVVVCHIAYINITLKNVRSDLVDQLVISNNLTDENEALVSENNTLTGKVTVLSETVSKKVASEEAQSTESIENALPKGFPLSGSAKMEEETDGEDPILVFTAAEGVNIITSGDGTVKSVDSDAEYGTKIIIDHGNGYESIYRNAGTSLVKTGEVLGKGYILFTVGEDNKQLGYQMTLDGEMINPMDMIVING